MVHQTEHVENISVNIYEYLKTGRIHFLKIGIIFDIKGNREIGLFFLKNLKI